jgi:argininosuccinate lyase
MSHLLMIESWYGGTGLQLPVALRRLSHRFTFVTRNAERYRAEAPAGQAHPVFDAETVLERDTNDEANLLDFLLQQHEVDPFDGVLTSCDYYLGTAARAAARLGLPGSPPAALDTARLKHRMRQALADAGLPNPAFRVATTWPEVRDAANALGYPLVFKPVDLNGGTFVTLVADEPSLHAAFNRLAAFPINNRRQIRPPEVLLEAYLDGPEVSVEAVTLAGQTTVLGLTDKSLTGAPHFIEDGHMFPAAVDPEQTAVTVALVGAALAAVGYTHGLSHTEVRLTSDGPRIVEINPRLPGNSITELVQLVTGLDQVELLVRVALGEQPDLTPRRTGVASAAVHFLLAPREGCLRQISGVERFADDPDLVRWEQEVPSGTRISAPRDNDYLGRVLFVDRSARGARARAEWAIAQLQCVVEDSTSS